MKLKTEITKFKLGVHTYDPSDARSLSRLYGPLRAMQKQDSRLEIIPSPLRANEKGEMQSLSGAWDWFTECDAVLFLDAFAAQDLNAIIFAKVAGTKVWCDYIDDLLNVRVSNPFGADFIAQRAVVRQNIEKIIELSDIATCTTRAIKTSFAGGSKSLLERMVILPESCRWPKFELPRRRVISWRGAAAHQEDLESVLPAIKSVANDKAFDGWEWFFMGDPTWKVADCVPNEKLIIAPFTHPYQFMQLWAGAAPFLHIVPIVDNAFNRSKTALAWMEATAVGAAVIGPKLPEWEDCNGVAQYDGGNLEFPGKQDFETVLREELAKWEPVSAPSQNGEIKGKFHPNVEISRADIYPDKTLEAVNELRWIILNKLAGNGQSAIGDSQRGEVKLEVVER